MKIALINGSPKIKESASGLIIDDIKGIIEKSNKKIMSCSFHKPKISEKEKEELYSCDVILFAFPLYVDAIPSHLLYCLKELEEYFQSKKKKAIRIYTIVNCGFYEANQNRLAIEIIKNWTARAGLLWGQGVGIGAGGMLAFLQKVPMGRGPKKSLGQAYDKLVSNILNGRSGEPIFVTPNFPRFLYKYMAQKGWQGYAKSNGLAVKELHRRL
jgi:multimeric flavodoxin WrbA